MGFQGEVAVFVPVSFGPVLFPFVESGFESERAVLMPLSGHALGQSIDERDLGHELPVFVELFPFAFPASEFPTPRFV